MTAERPTIGWSPTHTATGQRAASRALWLNMSRPCSTCWEQRTVWVPSLDGPGLVAVACPTCSGRGRVLL